VTLPSGTRLGPYEILAPLGAGGMGEVYRARDTRLEREVAIKVLPSELASDSERLRRFEKEARSASSLNHPNIVTIYDIGSEGGVSWIAMEKVEGATLRELLVAGAMAVKKLLQIAPQIAEGLARAHEAGIVHRDLKPENVMVTKDGLVKILDFGLAKLSSTMSGSDEGSQLPTMTGTTPGVVVGTVGYMSPEQASGVALDYRSDQFSLGSILYEMATGKRAFQKKTAIDTLAAILNEEPESIGTVNPQVPAPLRWIVERCLEKEPEGRYVSTRDLARELSTVRDHVSEASLTGVSPAAAARKGMRVRAAVLVLVFGAAIALGIFAGRPVWKARYSSQPTLRQVTFRRATIGTARFAPDGRSIIYVQIKAGGSPELHSVQPGNPESKSLGLPPAMLASVSGSGELAILLGTLGEGTLATVSLSGGAPRELMEGVRAASWAPDGKTLAVVHRDRIEYPPGKVLYQPSSGENGSVFGVRFSPSADRILFLLAKGWVPAGANPREAMTVDLSGRVNRVATIPFEVAWSPRGDGIWFNEIGGGATSITAVALSGKQRFLASFPGDFVLQDVSREGRVLLESAITEYEMVGGAPGRATERNLSWLDGSVPADLSADGRLLLFSEVAMGGGFGKAVYKRGTDGSPAVRLGEGTALALSPDGKWALASQSVQAFKLVLLPTGPGQARELPPPGIGLVGDHACFFPDGKRILVRGVEVASRQVRLYDLDIETGKARAVTPEGISPYARFALSPDGKLLVCMRKGIGELYNVEGGAGRPVTGLPKGAVPIQWCDDGRLFVKTGDDPVRVYRLTLSTGRLELWKEFSIAQAGNVEVTILPTSDGKSYVYGYKKYTSDLFIADGLR
jgi:hypothetical protein